MNSIQEKFEHDCKLLGRYDQKTLDRYRTADSYSADDLKMLFDGYCIGNMADDARMKAYADSQIIADSATLKLVETLHFGPGAQDIITAAPGYTFGYALITNKMWPKSFDEENFVVNYEPVPSAAGSEYIDIVLVRHEDTADKAQAKALLTLKQIDDSFRIKTSKVTEVDGFELRRITMMHDAFEDLQAQ